MEFDSLIRQRPYDLKDMIIFFHNIYIGSIPIMVKGDNKLKGKL